MVDLDNDLSCEDSIEPIEESNEGENIHSMGLNKERLSRIIQCLNEASDLAAEFDENYERAHSFQNSLRNAVKPYHVLAQQEKSKKQQDISKFFTNKVSEKQATDINSSKIASLFAKQTTKNKVAEKKIELNKSLVVDIEESSHDLAVVICKCEKLATHFCRSCDQNLCKFCIIDHYKNKNFIKDHEMIPL